MPQLQLQFVIFFLGPLNRSIRRKGAVLGHAKDEFFLILQAYQNSVRKYHTKTLARS